VNQANFGGRIDQNWSERQRTFGRFGTYRTTLGQPDYFGNPATPGPGANGLLYLNNYTAGVDHTIGFGPSSLLNVRYGFARLFWGRPTRSFGFDESQLAFPKSFWPRCRFHCSLAPNGFEVALPKLFAFRRCEWTVPTM